MTNTIKGIESGRAEFAYEMANSVRDNLKKAYKSHVKSFPMMIKTNGLGASIAFLFSKKGKEKGVYDKVGEHIVEWLRKDDKYKTYSIDQLTDLKSLTSEVTKIDSSSYRALTVEIIAYFTWLRRFAEGLCED